MEVKCYDCKRMFPEGEAIRQSESEGYAGGGSSKGAGGGSWSGESVGYWLCYPCHEKRKKRKFWTWVIVITIFVLIFGGIFLYMYLNSKN